MSNLNYDDFSTPFSHKTHCKLIGKLNAHESVQLSPATLAGAVLWVATFAGTIGDVYVSVDVLPGAGESMVFDLKKNGVSMLTGTKTVNNATTDKLINMRSLLDSAQNSFVSGDLITIDRTYVAGATPAPMVTNVATIEPSLAPYFY